MFQNHRVAVTFALLGIVESMVLSITGSGFTRANIAFIISAGVFGGVIGHVMWRLVVISWDRWTIPVRGAIAGALTGWLSLPPVGMALFTPEFVDGGTGAVPSLIEILEFGMGFGLVLVTGTIAIGWVTIPTAAITGYFVGREQAQTAKPF